MSLRSFKRWVRESTTSERIRRSSFAYDLMYWRRESCRKAVWKCVIGIIAICFAGAAAFILVTIFASDAKWLGYLCIGGIIVFSLLGIEPLLYRLWQIIKELKRKKMKSTSRH